MSLRRLRMAMALTAVVACPVRADLTLTGHGTLAALGMPSTGPEALLVKGRHLRRDRLDRGKAFSFLYDLDTREVTVLDHSLRTAEVYSMGTLSRAPATKISVSEAKRALTPTGRSTALKDWICQEYKLDFTMPTTLGNEKVTLLATGTVGITRNTRAQSEFAAFVKAAQEPDLFLGIPAAVASSPDQVRAVSEIIRQLAPLGIPCAAEVDIKYEGSGPMAELGRKFATRMSMTYEAYAPDTIPDASFAVPAGYRVVRK